MELLKGPRPSTAAFRDLGGAQSRKTIPGRTRSLVNQRFLRDLVLVFATVGFVVFLISVHSPSTPGTECNNPFATKLGEQMLSY